MIELYVTPFDQWATWEGPEGSVVSNLTAGQVIGFAISVIDSDRTESKRSWVPDPGMWVYAADTFLDGVLLPSEPEDSAIDAVSWGRIKASLD